MLVLNVKNNAPCSIHIYLIDMDTCIVIDCYLLKLIFFFTYNKGLILKKQGEHLPCSSYDCAVFPFLEKPVSTDYKVLVSKEVPTEHICYHCLTFGDNICQLISSCNKAQALVLINTDDNYILAPEITEKMRQQVLPIVLLTNQDGLHLTAIVKQVLTHGNIMAKLNIADSGQLVNEPRLKLYENFYEVSKGDLETVSQVTGTGSCSMA